ncbi:hypothetical protein ACFOWE_00625 [Planomonospora corallina]|uniref:Uncharacterized protein n=1 Tax=Planomonospora corallina TaxID=1806052 RepID=A0ABV8I149_9ACTN
MSAIPGDAAGPTAPVDAAPGGAPPETRPPELDRSGTVRHDRPRRTGFLLITTERWWELTGPFWRRRMVNGRELPHWHIVTRREDGSWEYEDTVDFASTPEELDRELAELGSGCYDGRRGRLRMEWLEGDEAGVVLDEHFPG